MAKKMILIVYDPTDRWLSWIWRLGAWLYCLLGWADEVYTNADLDSALSEMPLSEDVEELQFWCHGSPGRIYWNGKEKTANDFKRPLVRSGGLLWFRSCGTMAGLSGRDFCDALSSRFSCRVAAHTYSIGQWGWQSGLHVHDSQRPYWNWVLEEGVRAGPIENPRKLRPSGLWEPNTVTALTPKIPEGIQRGRNA